MRFATFNTSPTNLLLLRTKESVVSVATTLTHYLRNSVRIAVDNQIKCSVRMTNCKMTIILLLSLCYLISTANAGCHSDTRQNWECDWKTAAQYQGPPGEIVGGKPTLPSDVSFNQSAGMDAMLDIITGAIGTIPDVGALLAGFFTAFRTIFGQSGSNQALEDFYRALKAEVDAIIEYVDAKVLELQVNDIKNTIGGLESAALNCEDKYTDPSDLKICLIAVQGDIIGQEKFFFPYVPSNPTPGDVFEQGPLLEQLIPMWRHYCDLRLAVTLELVTTLRHLGQEEEAQNFIDDLPETITMFVDWWNIVYRMISFYSAAIHDSESYQHNMCKFWEGNTCGFKAHTYDIGQCMAEFGPSGSGLNCVIEEYVGCKHANSRADSFYKAEDSFEENMSNWLHERQLSVSKYYNMQAQRTVDHWKDMKNKLEAGKGQQRRIERSSTSPSYMYSITVESTKSVEKFNEALEDEGEVCDPRYPKCGTFFSRYYQPRYCSSKACDPSSCSTVEICIENICQKISYGWDATCGW